jgi:hypothetical protein
VYFALVETCYAWGVLAAENLRDREQSSIASKTQRGPALGAFAGGKLTAKFSPLLHGAIV